LRRSAEGFEKINTPTVEEPMEFIFKVSKYLHGKRDYLRGFGYQGGASRVCGINWLELTLGDFKDTCHCL
jgi:hypothetical protein